MERSEESLKKALELIPPLREEFWRNVNVPGSANDLNQSLEMVKSQRARSKIRQWFKRQDRKQNISHGRLLLERELRRLGIDQLSLEQMSKEMGFSKVDDFLAANVHGHFEADGFVMCCGHQIVDRGQTGLPAAIEQR